MSAADRIRAALRESCAALHRQRADEERARCERQKMFQRILAEHPDEFTGGGRASRIVQRHRVMAALAEFGAIGSAEANRELGVVAEIQGFGGPNLWSLEHIGQEMIDAGLPVEIISRRGPSGLEETWLALVE